MYEAELDCSFEDITAQLPQPVHAFQADEMTSADAVKIQCPLRSTTFFPLSVLFEGWSRAHGHAHDLLYIDAFVGLLLGLLDKGIGVDVAGRPCQSQPGSGKSLAANPHQGTPGIAFMFPPPWHIAQR